MCYPIYDFIPLSFSIFTYEVVEVRSNVFFGYTDNKMHDITILFSTMLLFNI